MKGPADQDSRVKKLLLLLLTVFTFSVCIPDLGAAITSPVTARAKAKAKRKHHRTRHKQQRKHQRKHAVAPAIVPGKAA
jgi:multisubunit Na+/H+ antiporter MnhG subunit